ncbi:NmrA family NAD(P)-binding protein [Knoellia sp. CPCC 206453]|uniref:NmrA family NAD(P)-binding protein n=1 Tax=Knoellia pratensis TaxID=3404796 RepID=UPI0036226DA4
MILVTAAHGNQGKLLVPMLLTSGAKVRASVRSEESARALRSAGVDDVVVGDLGDPGVLARAVAGVDEVYYVGPALHPGEREVGFTAVDAAAAAGVRHFVFSSVLHAITTDLVQHEVKRDIEEHLLSSGLDFTILQPANYMLRHRLLPAFRDGVFRLSWSLDRRQSMVDVADVTAVAAAVLLGGEGHHGATYELASPGRYTAHDIAATISEVIARQVVAKEIGPEDFLKAALGVKSADEAPYQARLLRAISARYSSHDFVGNPNVLGWLLGRPPTTFREFVQREFDAFRTTAVQHPSVHAGPGGPS